MVAGESGCADGFSEYEALASSLPALRQGLGSSPYRKYGGFWYPEHLMAPTLAMRNTFAARPPDVILATMPKSGTTWLKALVYAVVHRARHAPAGARHPLLASSPHELVPFLQSIYESHRSAPPGPLLEGMPPPRLLAVHAPFAALPASVPGSGCRVVYLCRDPKDVVALCSLDRMRSVQANRDGVHGTGRLSFKNMAFFRKGEVGDWKAHMTPELAQRIDGIVEEKLRGSGLSLTAN